MIEARGFLKSIARLIDDCKNIKHLKQIHSQIITSPYFSKSDHLFLISRLIFFCTVTSPGSFNYAARVFQATENPNLFIYNAMIRSYSNKNETPHSSLVLYKQMLLNSIVPDCITLPFLMKECTTRPDFISGQTIHAHSIKFGFADDVYVGNSMINFYSACGVLTCARKVFDEMSKRDTVSWNSIITGCLKHMELDSGVELFTKMDNKNIITWNTIITGLVHGNRPKPAIDFFNKMITSRNHNTIHPDKITLASVISACASLGWIHHGKCAHSYMLRNGIEYDIVIKTAMVDMYGKCGNIDLAIRVFENIPKKDVLAWTSMISIYALHGYGNEAFNLFDKMVSCGTRPNIVTFGALLTACVHLGLINKGRWYFKIMKNIYLIDPTVQHYACMVDILVRGGFFEEAERLITNMPMDPDVFVWGALLGGCQMHGNVTLGEKVAKYLISLEPLNHAFYVALCDMYGKAGKFDDLEDIRAVMDVRGLKKDVPGNSVIEVDGVVYEFSINGSCGVILEEIKSFLCQLSKEMKIDQIHV
ncbi:hypothetical protein LXL04_021698 [Taraxacum kok-saghyz]